MQLSSPSDCLCQLSLTIFVGLTICQSSILAQEDLERVASEIFVDGKRVEYLVNRSSNGESLLLNANNGFFDKGFYKAQKSKDSPTNEKQLISKHFEYLECVKDEGHGSMRWYLWVPAPGKIEFSVTTQNQKSGAWICQLGDESKTITFVAQESQGPQSPIEFQVNMPGKHVLELRPARTTSAARTRIFKIAVSGPAGMNSQVIRTRWRPAAIHTNYSASGCSNPKVWIFETRSVSKQSHYSPMTTPFGYFGCSFGSDGTAKGGVNFSMWAAGQKSKSLPPVDEMPSLFACGNRKAEFSGFGHEGSGLKIRNWLPFAHRPRSVVQALRVESIGPYDLYYGYYFDENETWVLYAAGSKFRKRQNNKQTFISPRGFTEIPGPPQVERTGDQPRVVQRRGWIGNGEIGDWHQVDSMKLGGKRRKAQTTHKSISAANNGWFQTTNGGVDMIESEPQVSTSGQQADLPTYMSPEKLQVIFGLPIEIGVSSVTGVEEGRAIIRYDLPTTGNNAEAVLYFGRTDCRTFVKRKLHATEKKKGVNRETQDAKRVWTNQTQPISVTAGTCEFRLDNLTPGENYFYRIKVTSDSGICWANDSASFLAK